VVFEDAPVLIEIGTKEYETLHYEPYYGEPNGCLYRLDVIWLVKVEQWTIQSLE
jgi:hypothetical protein